MFFKNIFAEYTFFISMSEDMRKDMVALGFPPDKILVHYHGIDTASFHVERTVRPRSDSLHILTIGNLEERKGHIVSLRAIKVLKSLLNTVNIKFRIVGSGPLKDNLKSFAEANGLRNNVEFREAVKHGPAFLDNLKWAHVFLHPSNITAKGNKEGIPGTIVEAMSSGLPVVSTVHAGIPETITHDVNGFLVQEKDYREIAKYLKILYENQDLSFTIGQRAREYACRNLDIHRRAIHLENIYLAALASTREKILRPYGDSVRE
jgi:colanic acid/amylovoran biosynthesis glycosyltransferase